MGLTCASRTPTDLVSWPYGTGPEELALVKYVGAIAGSISARLVWDGLGFPGIGFSTSPATCLHGMPEFEFRYELAERRRASLSAGTNVLEKLGNLVAQVAAVHDPINEAMRKGEFASLHPIGHSNVGDLGKDPWTDEPNSGSGFGEDNVAEEGKARDPSDRRVRQNTEVKP